MKKLIFISLVLLCTLKSQAQWTHEGPDYDGPTPLFKDDSLLFASSNGYLFYSTNDGLDWNLVMSAPPIAFTQMIKIGSTIIAHTQIGIMKSLDGGFNWVESNQGIITPNSLRENTMLKFQNGRVLLAMPSSGIYESLDSGQTWQMTNTTILAPKMLAFDSINNFIGCASTTGFYTSSDGGYTWNQFNSGLSSVNLTRIYFEQNTWFCTTSSNQIFISSDLSQGWSLANGVTGTYYQPVLLQINNKIYATRNSGLLEFDFNLNSFINSVINQSFNVSLTGGFDNVLYGFKIYNLKPERFPSYRTIDFGQTWAISNGIKVNWSGGFSEGAELCSKDFLGFCYNPQTNAFTRAKQPGAVLGTNSNYFTGIKKRNGIIYAATTNGVCTSNDGGQTWVQHLTGLPTAGLIPGYKETYDIELNGDTVIVATAQGPYISTDGANTFTQCTFPGTHNTKDFLWHNGKLYAAGNPRMLLSTDGGANWVQFGSIGTDYLLMAAAGPYIYSASSANIYMTIDSIGTTTNIIGNLSGMIGNTQPAIAAYDTLLFVANDGAVGVRKMNVNNIGVHTLIGDNLPHTTSGVTGAPLFEYLQNHSYLAVFDDKLWLSTNGLSCFTRPLSDFGYPPVVVTDSKSLEIEEKKEEGLRVYPNPSYNELNLQYSFDGESVVTFIISDLSGRLVQQQRLAVSRGISSINIKDLPEGMYLIELFDQKGNSKKIKFVKQ
jgi:hypothetical protein